MLVAACAPGPAPEPDPATKQAWADRWCSAVADAEAALGTVPPAADLAEPAAVRGQLTTYLAGLAERLTRSVTALAGLGAAPIAGGDRVTQVALESLRGAHDQVAAAQATLTSGDSPDLVAEALAKVVPVVADFDPAAPLAGVPGSDFTRWAERAANCARLPALGH
ncbi:hypothetical protein [Actinokineospora enzanensis]|uniref:hypothetical protein n=1 Tax=Actinokineospora enzanensis TaxID=155975 RepID=UPI00039B023E|nr:hypothetical protein [Actinokineospora enzanensis]